MNSYRAWAMGRNPTHRPCRMELSLLAEDETLRPLTIVNHNYATKRGRNG